MSEPETRDDGNRRIVSVASDGWPADPVASATAVADQIRARDPAIRVLDPPQIWIDLPPERAGADPATWRCQVGVPIVGLTRSGDGLLIEDYSGLQALVIAHHGSARDLPACHQRLADHARAMGWRLRPYWRVALRCPEAADGNPVPTVEVAVFIDR